MSSAQRDPHSTRSFPFDQYQRYRIVEQSLRILSSEGRLPTVLDVGGAPGQLFDFLPEGEITVVDRVPTGHPEVQGMDGTDLDYPDGSFDFVVAVDVLEHVPAERRARFLSEVWRVGRRGALIAAPFDSDHSRAAEAVLAEFIRYRLKLDHDYLREHKECGLPDRAQTRETLAGLGAAQVVDLPNGYLARWLPMMLAIYYLESTPQFKPLRELLNIYYNENHYAQDNREPAYRHLLIATREPLSSETSRRLETLRGEQDSEAQNTPDIGSTLGTLLAMATIEDAGRRAREMEEKVGSLSATLESGEVRLKAREEEIKALRAQMSALTEKLPEAERHIRNLEDSLEARKTHLTNVEKELEASKDHARNRDASSREFEAEAVRKTQYCNHLEILLQQREEQQEQMQKHLSDLAERLARSDRDLAEKGESVNDLRRHITDLEAVVEQLSRRYMDRLWSRLSGKKPQNPTDPNAS